MRTGRRLLRVGLARAPGSGWHERSESQGWMEEDDVLG